MAAQGDGSSAADQNSDASSESSKPEPVDWTIDNEIHLFHAMIGHKPAGINKHFNMIFICEKMSNSLNREVSSDCIWKYLQTLYNMEMLDEIEGIHFPNVEKEFSLPESEYGALMKQKLKEVAAKTEETDRSASPRVQNTARSQSRGAAHKENVSKSSKKETSEKPGKNQTHKDSSVASNTSSSDITVTTPKTEKDTNKNDTRRDSKESNPSSKEINKTSSTSTGKVTVKDPKTPKSNRTSLPEKLDDSATKLSDDSTQGKKGNKRSTRASLKPEEPTPPSRRRRI